jgi:hypothetical protein
VTPYYKAQLEDGILYQDVMYDVLHDFGISTVPYASKTFQRLHGENKAGIEIKHDKLRANTKKLYIEVAEKSDPQNRYYVPSGIYRKCIEYVIGDYDIAYRFSITTLRNLHKTNQYPTIEIKMKTSRGFLIPEADAVGFATQVFHMNSEADMKRLIPEAETREDLITQLTETMIRTIRSNPDQLSLFSEGEEKKK